MPTQFAKALGASVLLIASSSAFAAITSFTDDFQGYSSSPNFAPWECFSDNGGFPGGYGCGNPSTTGPQITALANDGAGNEFLNFYANYDNAPVHTGGAPNPQEAISVFRNFAYDASDTASGDTWIYEFDYKEADSPFGPAGATQVSAFIRVFDGAFNLLADANLDTSGSTAWQTGQLQITLDSAWTGGFFQVGFANLVGNYESSGMNYDNVSLNVVPIPAAVWLFASGLGMLGWARRGRK
ncbi:MAG: hypothetical protein HKN56_02650 [Gammaproteobacteria bacterium]|nr:VPLPA-CTERM sorting domain-containing protein [Gammaproteobacteria bacterium]NND53852.1 hypothetical protein [Gammaproteobacteria bacterium]